MNRNVVITAGAMKYLILSLGGSRATLSRATAPGKVSASGEVTPVYQAPEEIYVKIDSVPRKIQESINKGFNQNYRVLCIATTNSDMSPIGSGDMVVVDNREYKIKSAEQEYLNAGWGKYLAIERFKVG